MRLLIAIFCIALFASCASVPPVPPKSVEIDTSILQMGACEAGGFTTVATIAKIGDAYVTAKHFANSSECRTAGLPVDLHDPIDDISVIQAGDPGLCRDAVVGESVVYLGYPGSLKDGTIPPLSGIVLEYDTGLVAEKDADIPMPGTLLRKVDIATSRWVRPGYSGGPVVSARDGRIVGIINGISQEGHTYFTPISRVCRLIEEARHV